MRGKARAEAVRERTKAVRTAARETCEAARVVMEELRRTTATGVEARAAARAVRLCRLRVRGGGVGDGALPVFAVRLKAWRARRCLSLGALSVKSGVSKSALCRWETGRCRPRRAELAAVLVVLAVPAEERLPVLAALGDAGAVRDAPVSSAPAPGDLLRSLRLRRGWTQQQVAAALGVRQGMVAKWEASRNWPAAERITRACAVLGASEPEAAALCYWRGA